jgi:hypothetical protein
MPQQITEARKNLINVQFIDIQWLAAYGLTRQNALEYFFTSPFFDISSNNQSIRIQGIDLSQHESILRTMIGVEYILDDINTSEPNLYVIREQRRHSRRQGDVDLVNVYYILDGIIFQCPDFLDLLKSRISKTSNYLVHSFDTVNRSVRWQSSHNDVDGRHIPSGLQAWAPESFEDSSSHTCAEDTAQDSNPRKYQVIIREFPTFKTPLLDAHDARFECDDNNE